MENLFYGGSVDCTFMFNDLKKSLLYVNIVWIFFAVTFLPKIIKFWT